MPVDSHCTIRIAPIVFVLCLFLRCDLREKIKKNGKKGIRGKREITMRVEWTNKIIVVCIERITNE